LKTSKGTTPTNQQRLIFKKKVTTHIERKQSPKRNMKENKIPNSKHIKMNKKENRVRNLPMLIVTSLMKSNFEKNPKSQLFEPLILGCYAWPIVYHHSQ
jgi:hypothetical protein